ncbi:FadR/GntR family transcriptional regulator [Shimia sp.]|uniref:FadR/GntR family transcriptional regulator n=1 Tax=Shimia sp. TaxID=1954381 RepID=UPI003BAA5FD3
MSDQPTKPTPSDNDASRALEHLEPGNSRRTVLDALSRMIENAQLGVGDRLPPEIAIARKLEVSRAKVREALIAWQNMGIVTRNKKAGTVLAAEVFSNAIHMPMTLKLEAESLLRTHSVRRPLEIEAVRLAARHINERHGRLIMGRVEELMTVYSAGEDWREADHKFHAAIHAATGNPLFAQLVLQIQQGFNEIYETPLGQPQLGQNTIPLHPDLAAAVVRGEEDKAADVMARIMDMVETEVRKVMETYDV